MFSVVMGVYNESDKELIVAIESILAQTYAGFEFIIVLDDPANASAARLIARYARNDKRIAVLPNDANIGLGNSLNRAIDLASGNYIVRMDADDFSHPNRLEKLASAIDGVTDVYFTKFNFIADDGRFLKKSQRMPEGNRMIRKVLKQKCIISHPTVMFRASTVKKEKYSDLRYCEDHELWVRLLQHGYSFKGINDVMLDYTVRQSSMTTSDYYRSYFAVVYFWDHYMIKENSNVLTNDEFMLELGKHGDQRRIFNSVAGEYFRIVNDKKNRRKTDCLRLLLLFAKSPQLLDFFCRSAVAGVLRRMG